MEQRHIVLIWALVFLGVASFVIADPQSPSTLSPQGTSTLNTSDYGLRTANAIAGNITSLVLTAIGQTKAWQGYYGNVSGTITLDDAQNFTFYNWSSAEPQGQIYATLNSSITWSSVDCFEYIDGVFANRTTIENYYGIQTDDPDGINETFNDTNHPSFTVGSRTMTGCPTTYVFQSDNGQRANFVNVLLYDNTSAVNSTGWIYTSIIENDQAGVTTDLACYNGAPCDFQILVNDDGHGTDTATTLYYFWVELT
jgi:hypothetical protein